MKYIKQFSENVADFALENGYPITEQGFVDAMNAYVLQQSSTMEKLQRNGEKAVTIMFNKAQFSALAL